MFSQSKINLRFLIMTTALLSSMFIVSCEDDDHDHDEEHTDAEGFVLENSAGVEIYKEFKGAQTGSVTLSVNDTLELAVHFLGDDGKELEHEEDGDHEEEGKIVVSGNTASIALVEVEEEHGDDHDHDHAENALEIIGVGAGSTSFKLELMHDGHADYTSTNNVPIVVK